MSVTAIPARMVPRVKTLPTLIGVTALCQSQTRNPGVGPTVKSAWLVANSTSVNMEQVVSLC